MSTEVFEIVKPENSEETWGGGWVFVELLAN